MGAHAVVRPTCLEDGCIMNDNNRLVRRHKVQEVQMNRVLRKMEMHLFQIQRRLCKLQRIAVRTETRLMKYAEKTGVNVY